MSRRIIDKPATTTRQTSFWYLSIPPSGAHEPAAPRHVTHERGAMRIIRAGCNTDYSSAIRIIDCSSWRLTTRGRHVRRGALFPPRRDVAERHERRTPPHARRPRRACRGTRRSRRCRRRRRSRRRATTAREAVVRRRRERRSRNDGAQEAVVRRRREKSLRDIGARVGGRATTRRDRRPRDDAAREAAAR